MIRIAIFADSIARAEAVAGILRANGQLQIIEASALRAGNARFSLPLVDVVILDGVAVEKLPLDGPPVVMIEGPDQDEALLRNELQACLPADVTERELSAAILAASQNLTVLTAAQAKRWLRRESTMGRQRHKATIEVLTARELQVLRSLADGLGNKEIADQLGISDHTAKFHVAQILAKLHAGSRAEAVSIGIRRGLVPI